MNNIKYNSYTLFLKDRKEKSKSDYFKTVMKIR